MTAQNATKSNAENLRKPEFAFGAARVFDTDKFWSAGGKMLGNARVAAGAKFGSAETFRRSKLLGFVRVRAGTFALRRTTNDRGGAQ